MENLQEVLSKFGIDGVPDDVRAIKTGHINQTCVVTVGGKKYTVQAINTYVFTRPYDVMENILSVTEHLRKKVLQAGGDPSREVLHFYTAEDGKGCWKDAQGRYWRVYDYIDDAVTYDVADDPLVLTNAGAAFGMFQRQLADFPGKQLHETIVQFHDTGKRFADFEASVNRNAAGRAETATEEIEFFRSRAAKATHLTEQIKNGILPLRVTHNDTKFNNILMDPKTGKALCVIDLDTIMPGLAAHDFGDAIRFCANSAAEDERDLTKVFFDLNKYEAFAKGFIGTSGAFLTEAERDSMAWGALLMTLECGVRFLADYLDGDKYFHTDYPDHNLVRAHTQMKLARQMEEHFEEMNEIVLKYAKESC